MKPRTRQLLDLLNPHPGYSVYPWLCGQELVDLGIGYRYSARIGELREEGIEIESRVCRRHEHRNRMYEYRLAPDPPVVGVGAVVAE